MDPGLRDSGWTHDQLAFLAGAGAELLGSLDEDAVRACAARLPVPFLAEQCLLEDVSTDVPESLREPSRIVVPLRGSDRCFGALVLHREGGQPYEPGDVALAEELAGLVSRALENAARYREAVAEIEAERRREEELEQAHVREKKRGDEDFARFMRGSPIGIAVVADRECRHVVVNPALAELLHVEPALGEALTPLPLERLRWTFYRDGQPMAPEEAPLAYAARHGVEVRNAEFEILFPDGARCALFGHATPFFDDEGRFKACMAAFVDVTDRKRAEEALAQADRNKDAFLALLGHELRTPLAALTNALYLLRRRTRDNPPLAGPCEIMERQLGQVVRLVEDLQDVSRVKRGRLHLQRELADLSAVAHHAVEVMRPQAEARELELHAALPPEPILAEVDAGRIEQVLTNLLGNAVKYTNPGGTVRLTLDRQGDQARVSVKDSGIGMPAELLPNAFDLYRQADQTLSRSQGGLGIGLALVRGIVELHGGTVVVSSEGPDRGSEFVLTLPLVSDA